MKKKLLLFIMALTTVLSMTAQWHPEAEININNVKTKWARTSGRDHFVQQTLQPTFSMTVLPEKLTPMSIATISKAA